MTSTALDITDERHLQRLEETIERGLTTFVEVGSALAEIRDSRLYRERYTTFEAYCQERWGWNRRYANRIIGAADVGDRLGPMGPVSERQARPLTKLPPEKRGEAWSVAVETAAARDTKITGAIVQEVVQSIQGTSPDPNPALEHLRTAIRAVRAASKSTQGTIKSRLLATKATLTNILAELEAEHGSA